MEAGVEVGVGADDLSSSAPGTGLNAAGLEGFQDGVSARRCLEGAGGGHAEVRGPKAGGGGRVQVRAKVVDLSDGGGVERGD